MKALVTYFSQTGNTRKVAQAIYDAIQADKEIKDLSQVKTLDSYDLVFVGSPILRYGPAPEVASFLGVQAVGKQVALFITHASPEGAEMVQEWLDNCKAAASQVEFRGMFNCQGELGEQVANYMLSSGIPALVEWAKQRPFTLGQPDTDRLRRAQDWANRIVNSWRPDPETSNPQAIQN